MARDTRGPMPPETAGMRRISLTAPHWQQGRRLLLAQAAVTGLLGVVGLIGVLARPQTDGWQPLGVPLTPALSIVLLGIAAVTLVVLAHRRAATVFTLVMTAVALALMIICAVAAAHRDPGPLGFTAPAIVLWSILFCYNIGSAMWLLPDQIEGPTWIQQRRSHR